MSVHHSNPRAGDGQVCEVSADRYAPRAGPCAVPLPNVVTVTWRFADDFKAFSAFTRLAIRHGCARVKAGSVPISEP